MGFSVCVYLVKIVPAYESFLGKNPIKVMISTYIILNFIQVLLYGIVTFQDVQINTFTWSAWLVFVLLREWLMGFMLTFRFVGIYKNMSKFFFAFGFINTIFTLNWFSVAVTSPYGNTLTFQGIWNFAVGTDFTFTLITRAYMLISDFLFLYCILKTISVFNKSAVKSNEACLLYYNCVVSILLTILDVWRTLAPKSADVGGFDFLARLNFDFYLLYFIDFSDRLKSILRGSSNNKKGSNSGPMKEDVIKKSSYQD
ncbi:hypothetical protein HDV04_000995 [Boothiomyces sp. JEL0838]|nr:hypothetical protein HDV04_000995 [Boothiomyces sp. JEL0838]